MVVAMPPFVKSKVFAEIRDKQGGKAKDWERNKLPEIAKDFRSYSRRINGCILFVFGR